MSLESHSASTESGSSEPALPVATNSQSEHDETHQALINLEAEVTANPTNFQAWTRLGNLYFDTNQPQKAIEAYNKSLELHTGDANILTDLGVMYRRTQQPDKAIASFDRAIAADPTHQQSRFNKGIVLFYDKGDKEGALAAWEELLKIDPQAKTGNGESIRDFINSVRADLAAGK